eukprot:c16809_g1_i1 orf=371-592(-)
MMILTSACLHSTSLRDGVKLLLRSDLRTVWNSCPVYCSLIRLYLGLVALVFVRKKEVTFTVEGSPQEGFVLRK